MFQPTHWEVVDEVLSDESNSGEYPALQSVLFLLPNVGSTSGRMVGERLVRVGRQVRNALPKLSARGILEIR